MYRLAAKYRLISAFQLLLVAFSMMWSSPMAAGTTLQSLRYDQQEQVVRSDKPSDGSHVLAPAEFVAEVEVETEIDSDAQLDSDGQFVFYSDPVPGWTMPRHVVWTATPQVRCARTASDDGLKIYILLRVLRI